MPKDIIFDRYKLEVLLMSVGQIPQPALDDPRCSLPYKLFSKGRHIFLASEVSSPVCLDHDDTGCPLYALTRKE